MIKNTLTLKLLPLSLLLLCFYSSNAYSALESQDFVGPVQEETSLQRLKDLLCRGSKALQNDEQCEQHIRVRICRGLLGYTVSGHVMICANAGVLTEDSFSVFDNLVDLANVELESI